MKTSFRERWSPGASGALCSLCILRIGRIGSVFNPKIYCDCEIHLYSLFLLQYLCECQFDDNLKFKTLINEEDPDKMRLQPIGRDKEGLLYWLQLDQDQNIRVYSEEQDDLDGSSWKCIAR